MPTALSTFLIAQLGIAAGSFGATLVTAVVTIGFTVGASVLVNSIFGPSQPKPSDGQQNVRIAVGSRQRHYGIVHTGGQVSFLDSTNGTLGKAVTLGTGLESDILEHRINDKVVTLDGSGTVTEDSYHGAIHIHTRPGDPDQTSIAELTAIFPEWTADHRQRGCALAVLICDPVKQEHFSEVFNGRLPDYTQVRKAARCYDPRKDSNAVIGLDEAGAPIMGVGAHRLNDATTWEWTDNGPLVTADYFAHPDGYGGGFENVNWTNIAQEADIADEQVLTVTGESIARWRIWASYGLATEKRQQVLANMLKAIDGFCWQDADGKFNLMAGRFEEPDITVTDDHILAMSATLGADAARQVSAVKVLYTEAAIGYREQESATIDNPEVVDDPSTDPQAVEAYYIPAHNQAARVGKIVVRQLGERWHITARLNLYGLNLLGRRFVRLTSATLGITAAFKVDAVKLHLVDCAVEATLAEVKAEDWNFDAASEEGTPPLGPGAAPAPVTIPAPTGLTLAGIQIVLGGVNAVAIEASWDDPGRPDFSFEVRYRPSAGGTWAMMSVVDDAFLARSGPVNSGTEYEVQVRALTLGGRASAWSASATITPVAAATLSPPSGLSATGGAGEATVRLTMPTDANVAFARLYHSSTNDFGTATQVGGDIEAGPGVAVEVADGGLSAGTEFYWARAFDGSGGSSALTGPASATIS